MPARRATLALLVVVAGVLGGAAPAGASLVAHAQLVSTTPADGETVETVDAVTLTFSEDVSSQFLQVRVEGPGGDEADGNPVTDGRDVVQALPADLPAGEHRVTYRVVSVDGHPVSGTFSFTTTGTSASTPPPSAATSDPPETSAAPAVTQRATPTPSADPSSAPAETAPGWAVPVLAGLVVLPVLAGAWLLLRRRRHPAETPPS